MVKNACGFHEGDKKNTCKMIQGNENDPKCEPYEKGTRCSLKKNRSKSPKPKKIDNKNKSPIFFIFPPLRMFF